MGWGGKAVWPLWRVGLDWVGGLGWVWGWMGWKEGGEGRGEGGNDDVIRHTFSIHALPRALPLAQHEQEDVILRNNEKGLASK